MDFCLTLLARAGRLGKHSMGKYKANIHVFWVLKPPRDFCLTLLARAGQQGEKRRKVEGKYPCVLGPETYGSLPYTFGEGGTTRGEAQESRR